MNFARMHLTCPLAMLVLCSCVLPQSMAAQSGNDVLIGSSRSELARRIQHEVLDPVLENLKAQSSRDARLTDMLANVRLHTLPTPVPHVGHNAASSIESGHQLVEVDLGFLGELSQVANFTALGILATSDSNKLI